MLWKCWPAKEGNLWRRRCQNGAPLHCVLERHTSARNEPSYAPANALIVLYGGACVIRLESADLRSEQMANADLGTGFGVASVRREQRARRDACTRHAELRRAEVLEP